MNNTATPTTIGLLFGGKSAEHEVSLRSAKNVYDALNRELYSPVLIAISRSGTWHLVGEAVFEYSEFTAELAQNFPRVALLPGDSGKLVTVSDGSTVASLHAVFPILHGPLGEDGTVQGLLELADVPYVGPSVIGSAVGMDKDFMKRLLRNANIAIAPYKCFESHEIINPGSVIAELGLPLFVKPANMGSSVGVSKADDEPQLQAAIEQAFKFDTKILIESAIVGDEIECAVLGNEQQKASPIGRIIPKNAFYSYETKYIDDDGAILEMPARISDAVAKKAQETALKVCAVLSCQGLSRVDMFATKDGSIIVNEINTIPGFTSISMYPKLWELGGISYQDLISQLISLAIERHAKRQKLASTHAD